MYNVDNIGDLTSGTLSDFIRAYRDSLKAQRDSANKLLQQQRKNAQASIMSGANKMGMMYSNFPQRDKIRYDTETYMPAYVKNQTSYTTGLDSLRNNAINLWNTIKSYQESTEDYNTGVI